jgi:hypothetical protein
VEPGRGDAVHRWPASRATVPPSQVYRSRAARRIMSSPSRDATERAVISGQFEERAFFMRTRLRNVRTVSAERRPEKRKKPFDRARPGVFAGLSPWLGRAHRSLSLEVTAWWWAQAAANPVSPSKFPGSRELAGNFPDSGSERAFWTPINKHDQLLTSKFPTHRSREFFNAQQGISYVEQGHLEASLRPLAATNSPASITNGLHF